MKPKVAIIHYWLLTMRGGERVVDALLELYPEADLFTHVYSPENLSPRLRSCAVTTSFIQKLPAAKRLYRNYLPLMPMALEQLDLRAYDLVISSESGPAKGVLTLPRCLHICYCHTVMRYLWDMYQEYYAEAGLLQRLAMPWLTHYLRQWDLNTSFRVDEFVANSQNVARRINKTYRRDAKVIHPPVEVDRFDASQAREDFYLCVSQLVAYKRVDLLIQAFNGLRLPLVIIGEGPELRKLQSLAKDNIHFLGKLSDPEVASYLGRCRAFVFAADEDFGIVPVEAQAAGAPVLAFGQGGALETVLEGQTGLFFAEQSAESVMAVVKRFEHQASLWSAPQLREHAESFSRQRFLKEFGAHAQECWEQHEARLRMAR